MPVETPADLAAARDRIAVVADERRRIIAGADLGLRDVRRELVRIDHDLADLVIDMVDRTDPCDASPAVPLVLLPVRIETRMASGTSVLRVRIRPDEVHVDSLVRALTEREVSAGHDYWKAMWADAESPTAWGDLQETVGDRRSPWVAHATTPRNLADLGSVDPDFPATPHEVTKGVVARCLPDQFVVRVVPRGGAPITVTGRPVPRDLPISPIALADEELADAAGMVSGLPVPAGSEWTVDFHAAVAVGLGVEVELPAGTTRLDRVIAVGTRRSVDEDANADDFVDLLTSHRFTDGMSLLAAGTPTNNADAERSPLRGGVTRTPPPTTVPIPSTDAARMAAVLGLAAQPIADLLGDDAASTLDEAEQAANTALWFSSWEQVLRWFEDAEVPVIGPSGIEAARQFHRDHVRGAGPAPTLRVGAQPYGLLPVTDLQRWTPRRGETTAGLAGLVTTTLQRWIRRSGVVPRVRPGDSVSDEDLLEILGMSPVATGVRARPAADGSVVEGFAAPTGADAVAVHAELQVARVMLSQYLGDRATVVEPPSVHEQSRTIALPLVAERDAEVVEEILADRTTKVDSVLQALLHVAWEEAGRNRVRAAPDEFVPSILDLVGVDAEIRELALGATVGAGGAAGGLLDVEPSRFFAAAEQVETVRHFDDQPSETVSLASLEPLAEARTSMAQVALSLADAGEAAWIGSVAVAGLLRAIGARNEVRAAMQALTAAPIEERRIAVAHALDVASHRVDAWATGLADARRAGLARDNPVGLTLGAFGYVEDVRLGRAGREPEGWLHAPSSGHAVAAGVLASAHRSNIGAKDGQHPFAIDLSSRRGVQLRRVLEGVQAGQPIGALLGYQIERALTDSAARFQLSLRELAPMATDELGATAGQPEAQARAAAADVVDGVSLLRRFPMDELSGPAPALRTQLDEPPANPFIDGDWDPVSDDEWNQVVAALRVASDTLDAVSDALLSESVLQYASGNAARASAAMDAMSTGAAVDPDLGILGVRQGGELLTHTVLAAMPADPGGAGGGWSIDRPRAIAEPRLEAWAARRLGDPASIVVFDGAGGRLTLDRAGWAALDLVFADDVAELDRDLRAALPGAPDLDPDDPGTGMASARGDDWPADARPITAAATLAGSLRTLVSGATFVGPDALVRTGETPQRTLDVDEVMQRCGALLDRLRATLDAGAVVIAAIDPQTLAVAEAEVDAVVDAVAGLAAFGVSLVPDVDVPTKVAWAWGAWQAAAARHDQGRERLAAVTTPREPAWTDQERVDECQEVARGVLGDGFLLLPLLRPAAGPDTGPDAFVDALTQPLHEQPSRSSVNGFVRDHAPVTAGVGRLAEAQLLGRAMDLPVPLTIAQLAERDGGTPAPGTDRWLAGPLADHVPWPATPATHLVLELLGDAADFDGSFAALAIDGWTETLPFQPDPRAFDETAPDNPLRAHQATTGLAVHANQASARAPQVVLSAISPDGKRWTTDRVVATVEDAVALARARLVTLEHAPGDAAILPAIYVASPWLQPRKGLSFLELAGIKWTDLAIPFLSEVQ